MAANPPLRYRGSSNFRQRLICATLSGRHVRIDEIRALDESPGLRDYESSFLRLLERFTNGATIHINETGTSVYYSPGIIVGGKVAWECPPSRGIGYFLEGLLCMSVFAKKRVELTLRGVTNEDKDTSVDILRTVTLPLLKRFGVEEVELKITKRGAPPKGGGSVLFTCNPVRALKPLHFVDDGRMKRIRGLAYTTRVSPQMGNRLVDAAKTVLAPFTPDVFVYTDHYKGAESGLSPGYALSLVAESTSGALLSAEVTGAAGSLPEDTGRLASMALLAEIAKGGCFDTANQCTALLLMALGSEDASSIRVGELSPHTVSFLRLVRDFFGVTFKIQPDRETNTVLMSCFGTGFTNISKKVA